MWITHCGSLSFYFILYFRSHSWKTVHMMAKCLFFFFSFFSFCHFLNEKTMKHKTIFKRKLYVSFFWQFIYNWRQRCAGIMCLILIVTKWPCKNQSRSQNCDRGIAKNLSRQFELETLNELGILRADLI